MADDVLLALAERVAGVRGFDNNLDVQCEIALFEPGDCETAIRANYAGTKVIVTINGQERTFAARDWTISASARASTAAALRARGEIAG